MKWTIGTKIGGGFALALLALVIIGLTSYNSISGLVDTADAVDHSNQVLQQLELLISALKDAETGQRGFIITGEDRYLEPYNTALPQIDPIIKKVRDLTQDNPDQQPRLDSIQSLVQDKLDELKETIDLRRDPVKGFDNARQLGRVFKMT